MCVYVCVSVCMYVAHYSHPCPSETSAQCQPHVSDCLERNSCLHCNCKSQYKKIIQSVSDNWQTESSRSWRNSFVASPCYNLIGCGNVALYAALNGSLPSLADWAAKTACFLFLSLSVMCVVAEPVIELWKLAIFVFLWWCEMWSELWACVCVCVSECDGGGGSQSVSLGLGAALALTQPWHASFSLIWKCTFSSLFISILFHV